MVLDWYLRRGVGSTPFMSLGFLVGRVSYELVVSGESTTSLDGLLAWDRERVAKIIHITFECIAPYLS